MTAFAGDGPGARTLDGCSVELYRRLPYRGDVDFLAHHLPPGAAVLELGCGAGQSTARLLDMGFRVTAVDNSSEMLQSVPELAQKVCSGIESLRLADRHDAVLLPTGLIHHPSEPMRRAFLGTARRHLKEDGRLFVERRDPRWLATAQPGHAGRIADIDVFVDTVEHSGPEVAMTLRYVAADGVWRHVFRIARLDDADFQQLVTASGFGRVEWIDERKRWAAAALLR